METLSTLEPLVVQNNELLLRIYIVQLFVLGVAGAGLVIFLLYKFLRKFF